MAEEPEQENSFCPNGAGVRMVKILAWVCARSTASLCQCLVGWSSEVPGGEALFPQLCNVTPSPCFGPVRARPEAEIQLSVLGLALSPPIL